MAFGKHRDGDDVNGPDDTNDADDIDDVDELDGPFDIEDFDDPATAAVARLDLGSVLIPMPEAGQVQVELTERGVPSAVWVVTPNGRFTVAAYAAPKTRGAVAGGRLGTGRLAAQGRRQGADRGRPVGPGGGRVAAEPASRAWSGSSASTVTAG